MEDLIVSVMIHEPYATIASAALAFKPWIEILSWETAKDEIKLFVEIVGIISFPDLFREFIDLFNINTACYIRYAELTNNPAKSPVIRCKHNID